MLSDLWLRLRALFRRKAVEAELDDELRFHLESQIEKYIQAGMTPEEAKRQAQIELGGLEQVKEQCRDARGIRFLEDTWRDICYGVRMLRKSPGFTVVAVLTLALGIGANAAVFSVTYAILLKPLPFPDPSRLVQIWSTRGGEKEGSVYLFTPEYEAIRDQSQAFSQMAVYTEGACKLEGPGHAMSLQASIVSGNFFSVLGVRPLLGRPILPADEEAGHDHVALLSEGLWRDEFQSAPRIVGKIIGLQFTGGAGIRSAPLAPEPYTIIGVLPEKFPFPNAGRIFIPYPSGSGVAQSFQVVPIARLKDGVSLRQANAELYTIAHRYAAEGRSRSKELDFYAGALRSRITQGYRAEVWMLFGAVGFVLLLVFVNTGTLLLARGPTRLREVAVRQALGATRSRLLRQLLTESILVALMGGGLGVLLAYWGMDALLAIAPAGTPRLDEVHLSLPVLIYALAISCLGGLLFGIAPALESARIGPRSALVEGGSAFAGVGPRRRRIQQKMLAVAEVSLALTLAVGSALMLRSLWKLTGTDIGYRTDRVLTMWVQFSQPHCAVPEACRRAINLRMSEILERSRAVPGVEDAAFAIWRPLSSIFEDRLQAEGSPQAATVQFQAVSPDYFRTLGIPLLVGRTFTARDTNGSPQVAIVNEDLAARFFDSHALGKRISVSRGKDGRPVWLEVVGEVGNTRDRNPRYAPWPSIYLPLSQAGPFGESTLMVRTAVDPASVTRAVEAGIWAVDKGATVAGAETMRQILANEYAEPQFRAILLGAFGGLGLVLAVIGIYGVISCVTAERAHELAVRVALGASPPEILRLVLGEGVLLAGTGILLGIAAGTALTGLLRSFLFGVSPNDPVSFAFVAGLVAVITVAACYIPARRAKRVDPAEALRHE